MTTAEEFQKNALHALVRGFLDTVNKKPVPLPPPEPPPMTDGEKLLIVKRYLRMQIQLAEVMLSKLSE